MKQEENQRIKSGYDRWKRNVLRRCLNIASDGADVTCDGRLFQKLAPETGKARFPTVDVGATLNNASDYRANGITEY